MEVILTQTLACSFCGFDVTVPDGFIPNDVKIGIVTEKMDQKSGVFLLIVNSPIVQCASCRRDAVLRSKTVKPKGKRPNANKKEKATTK